MNYSKKIKYHPTTFQPITHKEIEIICPYCGNFHKYYYVEDAIDFIMPEYVTCQKCGQNIPTDKTSENKKTEPYSTLYLQKNITGVRVNDVTKFSEIKNVDADKKEEMDKIQTHNGHIYSKKSLKKMLQQKQENWLPEKMRRRDENKKHKFKKT